MLSHIETTFKNSLSRVGKELIKTWSYSVLVLRITYRLDWRSEQMAIRRHD